MLLRFLRLTLTIALLAPSLARAQDGEDERTAAARDLFEEGMASVAAGDLDVAADRLRRSYELRPSAVVAFNLAMALTELGRLVEATEHLRRIIRDEEAPEAVREAASSRLERLLPRIGRLVVTLEGPRAGARVQVSGAELPEVLIGVAHPVDPSEHIVVALRGSETVARESVTVAEGATREVTLRLPPLPAVREAPRPERSAVDEALLRETPEAPAGEEVDLGLVALFGTLGAAVLAGAIVAIVVAATHRPEPIPGNFAPPVVRLGE